MYFTIWATREALIYALYNKRRYIFSFWHLPYYVITLIHTYMNNIQKWSHFCESCWTLCDPMDCNLSGFSDHGIFQARILEWVAISLSRGSSQPRDWTWVSCIAGRRFTILATRETQVKEKVKVAQSCLTLRDPMDYKVHQILQARILEYSEAFTVSRGSFQPRDQTQVSHIAGRCFTSCATGKPKNTGVGSLSLLQWIFMTQEVN